MSQSLSAFFNLFLDWSPKISSKFVLLWFGNFSHDFPYYPLFSPLFIRYQMYTQRVTIHASDSTQSRLRIIAYCFQTTQNINDEIFGVYNNIYICGQQKKCVLFFLSIYIYIVKSYTHTTSLRQWQKKTGNRHFSLSVFNKHYSADVRLLVSCYDMDMGKENCRTRSTIFICMSRPFSLSFSHSLSPSLPLTFALFLSHLILLRRWFRYFVALYCAGTVCVLYRIAYNQSCIVLARDIQTLLSHVC